MDPSISSILTTAFGDMAAELLDTVIAVLPILLPIVGSMAAVGFGIKLFKKLTGKAG